MIRNLSLSLALLALLALLGLAIAITSGKFGGPSDIEMRVRASEGWFAWCWCLRC